MASEQNIKEKLEMFTPWICSSRS